MPEGSPLVGSSSPDIDLILGDNTSWDDLSTSFDISQASNIFVGGNPAYAVSDFLTMYPQFGSLDPTSGAYSGPILGGLVILNAFVTLASACLQQARWQDLWSMAMGFFIAHNTILYMQATINGANSTAAQVIGPSLAMGIKTSKSVGPLSVGIQALVSGWEDWGAFNLTLPGQQLMTWAKIVGGTIPVYAY